MAQSATRSIETDVSPDAIMALLVDPTLLPSWAPAFAGSVADAGQGRWRVRKGERDFSIEVAVNQQSRTVDYLREVAPGRKGGAYLRVLPLPSGGSAITMTAPIPAVESRESVVALLDQELEALTRLSTSKL
jgi:hypothetical protein